MVRQSTTAAWSGVKPIPGILFPELLDKKTLEMHYIPPPAADDPAPKGVRLVPATDAGRELVKHVRLETDSAGRPVEVEIVFSSGSREFRSYSGWKKGASEGNSPAEGAGELSWPPESKWGSDVETVLSQLSAKVRKYKSITGKYVREKRTQLLLKPVVAKGEFRFVPGRLLWMDEEPRPSRVLITRKKMEVYDPGSKRLERFNFGDSRIGDYVFVGFGDSAAVAFRSFRPLAFSRTEDLVTLRCRPVAGALMGHIDTMTLRIDAKSGLMKELSYVDPSGDSVSTKVSGLRTDRDLDESDVALNPAKGTRVIENSGEMPWR